MLGDVQSASHVIFGKAGAATQAMAAALDRLRELERAVVQSEGTTISDRTRIIAGSVAALWMIALLAFALVPAQARTATPPGGTRDWGLEARKAPEPGSDIGLQALGATQALADTNVTALPIDLDPSVVERLLGHPSARVQQSVVEFVERSRKAKN